MASLSSSAQTNNNNNTDNEKRILLVAVGDGQSRPCQETNRIFKFIRKSFPTTIAVQIEQKVENKKVVACLINDLVVNFWQTLLNLLIKNQQELSVKHIVLDATLKDLHTTVEKFSIDEDALINNPPTVSQTVSLPLLKTLSEIWENHTLIKRMFNPIDSDEYIQQEVLNKSIYSEFEYKTCESMIHYLMNDFVPRLTSHLESRKAIEDFEPNTIDYIFCSYKPSYRDLTVQYNNSQIEVTTINHETKDSINVISLLTRCSWLVFNFDLAIYCRNDLHEIVDMFCAKSRYENMTTHDSFYDNHAGDVKPVAVIKSGWNNMHMNLGRHGLGMLPSEMFSENFNFLAAEKVRAPKLYRSPNVTFKNWEPLENINSGDISGARFEELSEDEWSQVIKFVGNPEDMLSLSQTSSTLRSLIERNDDFWKDAMIGKSTNYMRDKKTKAFEAFVKAKEETGSPATWRHFYLYSRQEIHKNLPKEICDFIMKKNALSYVTGEREKKIPDTDKVKFFNADGLNLESMKRCATAVFDLVN
jgi:hypothetical protein